MSIEFGHCRRNGQAEARRVHHKLDGSQRRACTAFLVRIMRALVWAGAALCCSPGSLYAWDIFNTQRAVSSSPSAGMADRSARRPRVGSGPAGQPLTLQEAIERTLSNNPKTRQAWASVKVWAAAVGASKSAYLPIVSGDLEAVREDYATDVTGKPQLNYATRASVLSAGISLSWLLYDFGGREAAVRNATALLAAARATQEATLQGAFLSAARDYYAAQASQEALAVAKTLEKMANDSFVAASARVQKGVAPISDELQAQTAYAQARSARVRAEGDCQTALGVLASDMNLALDQLFVLPPINDSAGPDSQSSAALASLIRAAQDRHPSVLAARAQLTAALAKEQQVRAQGFPSASVISKYSFNNQPASLGPGLPEYPATGHDWYIGVQISIPIFDGFARAYQIRQAQAQSELQRYTLEDVEREVGLEIWKSYQAVQVAATNLGNTSNQLEIAQRSFEVTRHRYITGVGNVLELIAGQSSLADAGRQRVLAWADWRSARLQLAASLGRIGFDVL